MKNRPRPAIPVATKLAITFRQLAPHDINSILRREGETLTAVLERRLIRLAGILGCPRKDLRLDHDPPLRWRRYDPRIKNVAARFQPNANSPEYLIYRTKEDHHRKTNIRGDGAQFADRVLIARERRRERAESPQRGKTPRKAKWASRPLRSASRWQKKPKGE